MKYTETIEYAYDLLDHFYRIHKNQILCLGESQLTIMCPGEIYYLLKGVTKEGEAVFPQKFKGIELKSYSGSYIIFALKEIK